MKIKFIYQNGPLYYEAECLNEQERKEAVKGLIYATKDLTESNLLGYFETCQNEPVLYENEDVLNEPVAQVELATDGQKKYMTKLGIQYTATTTKIEAIDLINRWKTEHGIPLNKKN